MVQSVDRAEPRAWRECYFAETGRARTPIFRGDGLRPGAEIEGPAIIEESTTTIVVYPGALRGRDSSGGGYGDPLERDPARVLHDVLEGWESRWKAREVYGAVFTGEIEDDSLTVDTAAAASRRAALRKAVQS